MKLFKTLFLSLTTSSLAIASETLVYEGEEGIGKGKHIVFLANDHEYRSEQSCPLMAKLLAKHHGFRCTVLFGLDEEGYIRPGGHTVPGLEALDDADLLFFFARFMNLPDEQVDLLAAYFEKGGPAIGLRTSSHCFNGQKGKWEKFNYNYAGEDYVGGLGQQIFGMTWKKETGQGHYGKNHREGCRITISPTASEHPILIGIDEIHAYSGAYNSPLPEGATSLLDVQVLNTFTPSDDINKNKPLSTCGWFRENYTAPSGENKEARNAYISFGASEDLLDEDTRRFLTNTSLWAMAMEEQITPELEVSIVGTYRPSPYSTGSLFFEGVKPTDLAEWESSIMPEGAQIRGATNVTDEKKKKRLRGVFANRAEMAKELFPVNSPLLPEE